MHVRDQLASERTRDALELAEQLRFGRRARRLRRAQRIERRAEHRLVEAWRRTAELRIRAGSPDY